MKRDRDHQLTYLNTKNSTSDNIQTAEHSKPRSHDI